MSSSRVDGRLRPGPMPPDRVLRVRSQATLVISDHGPSQVRRHQHARRRLAPAARWPQGASVPEGLQRDEASGRLKAVGTYAGQQQPADRTQKARYTELSDLRVLLPSTCGAHTPHRFGRETARNYLGRAGRTGDAGLLGKWSSAPREYGTWCSMSGRPDQSGASASPTETPQLRDTVADPHRNPTD